MNQKEIMNMLLFLNSTDLKYRKDAIGMMSEKQPPM
jgi:hypothetical protein